MSERPECPPLSPQGWGDKGGPTGLASARNERPFLLQTYRRDMGAGQFVVMKEAAAPITAIVVINAACEDEDIKGLVEAAEQALARSETFLQGVAGDVADPNSKELGYDRVPAATVRPLMEGVAEVKSRLGEIKCPVLILHSPQDHVVGPGSVKAMREGIKAPIEYVALEKSYHVATIDFDREEINDRAVAFAAAVIG